MYEYGASGDTLMTEIWFLAIVDLVEWNFTGGSGQKTRQVIESVFKVIRKIRQGRSMPIVEEGRRWQLSPKEGTFELVMRFFELWMSIP